MRKVLLGVLALVVLAIATPVYFWAVQNANQVAMLRLDLASFGSWKMPRPMEVTRLMGLSFGVGALLAGTPFLLWGMQLRRYIERIERQLETNSSDY
jgi:hypothetical protein